MLGTPRLGGSGLEKSPHSGSPDFSNDEGAYRQETFGEPFSFGERYFDLIWFPEIVLKENFYINFFTSGVFT